MSAVAIAAALGDARRNIPDPVDQRNPTDVGHTVVIARIAKNKVDDIVVSLARYREHDLIDVRVHTLFQGVTERRPTKRGVSLKITSLPELIAALNAAAAEAHRLGLLPSAPDPAPPDSVAAKDRTAAERQRRRRERLRASRVPVMDIVDDSVTARCSVTPSLLPKSEEGPTPTN
jgi:hypothetical protein